jgi:hypothetical protein
MNARTIVDDGDRLRLAFVLAAVFALSSVYALPASAAIIGTATLIKYPAAVPFGSPDAALGSPWESYQLSVAATAGETIQAIQANITGQLHQRWNPDPDNDGAFLPTARSTNMTNGDTHLMAPLGSLFGSGPTEDNPGTGSPLASNTSAKYGVGTLLQGAWALVGGNVGSSANVAYLVIPRGSEINTNISVRVANPDGTTIGTLTAADFAGFLFAETGPVVTPLDLVSIDLNGTVSGQVTGTNSPINWGPALNSLVLQSYTPNYGAVGTVGYFAAPLWDPVTQQFSWNTTGAKRGDYVWNVSAANAFGTGFGTITVHIQLADGPEPASFVLAALAAIGLGAFVLRGRAVEADGFG